MLKYRFRQTDEIKNYLVEIEALKIAYSALSPLPHIEENLKRESLLKSSVFSARIEGNPLTLDKAGSISESQSKKNVAKLEVFNLLAAYNYLNRKEVPQKLTLTLILRLHRIVMRNLSYLGGKLRNEPWAIYNQAGVAVHLAPSHFRLKEIMKEYIGEINNLKIPFPVKAGYAQFVFEKIHPLADGNGRVGRLVSVYLLKKGGYDFKGVVSLEEYIDNNRALYYQALEPGNDATEFVSFFLGAMVNQARHTLEKLKETREERAEDLLLPRRREILLLIRDHKLCSFDFISRRFPAVNIKTLHYDLKKLQEERFVLKLGKTRGSLYKAAE